MAKIDLEEDASENRTLSSAELSQVSELAGRMVQIDKEKGKLEEQLKKLGEEQERIQGATLPALMEEIGLKSFKLRSGEEIIIKPIISGSLPTETAIEKEKDIDVRIELKDRRAKGLAYLVKNGGGALIKNIVFAELGKDSAKLAKEAVGLLNKLGLDGKTEKAVHGASLNSWIREKIESGNPPDFEIFKIYSGNRAEVKTNKPSKGKTAAAKA